MSALTAPVQNAFAHYLGKGIGRNPAAGIAGVLDYESGINSLAENNTGTDKGGVLNPRGAIGVAQWNGLRQGNGKTGLADFAKIKGENWQDVTTQLDFVLTECANSYPKVWAAIQGNMDIKDFVSLFVNEYENPANPAPEIAAGLATAQALLALPVAPTSTSVAAAPSSPSQTPLAVPAPLPSPPGASLMDPALITALAPIVESLAAGLFRALIAQTSTAASSGGTSAPVTAPTTGPTAPAIDLGSLANEIVPLLASQLGNSLPALIAAEIAKLTPPTTGAKP